MTQIQKFEPRLEITTKDGKVFHTPVKNKSALFAHLNSDKFIEIDGVILSSFNIIRVEEENRKQPPRKKDEDGIFYT